MGAIFFLINSYLFLSNCFPDVNYLLDLIQCSCAILNLREGILTMWILDTKPMYRSYGVKHLMRMCSKGILGAIGKVLLMKTGTICIEMP